MIFAVLLAFVSFEFYLIRGGHFELQRFYDSDDTYHGFTYHMRNDNRYRAVQSPGLGWEIDPSQPPLNAHGRFTNPKKIKKDQGIYRIIAIGDSVTEQGYYEKFLEDRLNDSILGQKFEVWNCGVGGYQMPQYYYYLKYKGVGFQPDMIIVGFTLGDISNSPVVLMTKEGYKAYENPFTCIDFPLNRYLFLRYRTYRFFIYNLEKFLKSTRPKQEIPDLIFKKFIDLAYSKDIKVVALIWPYMKNDYSDWELTQYKEIRTILENYGIPYLDLHESFDNRDVIDLRSHPSDYIHPSRGAFRIMTPDIHNFILENLDSIRQETTQH